MKNYGMNPYLPSWEYVPDGEPHVFGKRVYIYGSHDRFAGYAFCQNDYVCWSAPVDDLTDWQYEGIIHIKICGENVPLRPDRTEIIYKSPEGLTKSVRFSGLFFLPGKCIQEGYTE